MYWLFLLLLLVACGGDLKEPERQLLLERSSATAMKLDTLSSCTVLTAFGKSDTGCAQLIVYRPVDTITIMPPDTTLRGIPFGPMQLMKGDKERYGRGYAPFNLSSHSIDPAYIKRAIDSARVAGVKLILFPAGGSHCQYNTPGCDANGHQLAGGKFDMAKWKARIDLFATSEIKAALAGCVVEQTCMINVMDEPNHPSWGSPNPMNKARLDTMALYVKTKLGSATLVGATIDHGWLPTTFYRTLDFIVSQYSPKFSYRPGWASDTLWLREAAAQAKANKVGLVISANTTDWFKALATGTACPVPATGGPGSAGTDFGVKGCRITGAALLAFGNKALSVPEVCALTMWQYDTLTFDRPDVRSAVATLRIGADTRKRTECKRGTS
jgi:hypothetical protein